MSDGAQRKLEREAAAGDREAELKLRRSRCKTGQCCAHAPASAHEIEVPSLPYLWYENENGDRWYPNLRHPGNPDEDRPPEYLYQNSRFPHQITHSILRIVQPHEVAACEHPSDQVVATGGWIEGIDGRECHACNGVQVRNSNEPWPEEWEAQGSRRVMAGNTTWSEDLATELVKRGVPISDAILFSAIACERCVNIAAWKAGLPWGYPEDDENAKTAGTSCELCEEAP